MRHRPIVAPTIALAVVALLAILPLRLGAQEATPTGGAAPAAMLPNEGWDLHIDADQHIPGDRSAIAHHRCKGVAGGLTECQLYDGDAPDARLFGVEVVVDPTTYGAFDPAEQALWHYHKEELPRIDETYPDLSPEEAAQVGKAIEETYGKIYLLWDPSQGDQPIGQPFVAAL